MRYNHNILWPGFYLFSLIVFLFGYGTLKTSFVSVKSINGKKEKMSVVLLRLFFLILLFMSAFRGLDITNDTAAYLVTYRNIKKFGFAGEWRMEKGYVLLNLLLSKLFPNGDTGFYVLLFITSLFMYGAAEQWIEKESNTYGDCIIIFYFLFNSGFMCTIRQSIACAIILCALPFAKNKKYFKYTFLVLIAIFFHKASIIGVLFLGFINRKFDRRFATLLIGLAFIISIGTNTVTQLLSRVGITTSYVTNESGWSSAAVVMSFLYIGLLALNRVKKNMTIKHIYSNDFYLYCIVLSLASFLIMNRMPVMNRISNFFSITAIPYVSNVMDEIDDKRIVFFIRLILFTAVFAYAAIALIYRPEWQHLWPYNFYWSK